MANNIDNINSKIDYLISVHNENQDTTIENLDLFSHVIAGLFQILAMKGGEVTEDEIKEDLDILFLKLKDKIVGDIEQEFRNYIKNEINRYKGFIEINDVYSLDFITLKLRFTNYMYNLIKTEY